MLLFSQPYLCLSFLLFEYVIRPRRRSGGKGALDSRYDKPQDSWALDPGLLDPWVKRSGWEPRIRSELGRRVPAAREEGRVGGEYPRCEAAGISQGLGACIKRAANSKPRRGTGRTDW